MKKCVIMWYFLCQNKICGNKQLLIIADTTLHNNICVIFLKDNADLKTYCCFNSPYIYIYNFILQWRRAYRITRKPLNRRFLHLLLSSFLERPTSKTITLVGNGFIAWSLTKRIFTFPKVSKQAKTAASGRHFNVRCHFLVVHVPVTWNSRTCVDLHAAIAEHSQTLADSRWDSGNSLTFVTRLRSLTQWLPSLAITRLHQLIQTAVTWTPR